MHRRRGSRARRTVRVHGGLPDPDHRRDPRHRDPPRSCVLGCRRNDGVLVALRRDRRLRSGDAAPHTVAGRRGAGGIRAAHRAGAEDDSPPSALRSEHPRRPEPVCSKDQTFATSPIAFAGADGFSTEIFTSNPDGTGRLRSPTTPRWTSIPPGPRTGFASRFPHAGRQLRDLRCGRRRKRPDAPDQRRGGRPAARREPEGAGIAFSSLRHGNAEIVRDGTPTGTTRPA